MTDEQINATIARECGWKDVWRCQGVSESASFVGTSPDNQFLPVPNYCGDLNAMHEAENHLGQSTNMVEYTNALYDMACLVQSLTYRWNPYGLPARYRAEAFLRTLGKWKTTTEESSALGATDKDSLTVDHFADARKKV
jgi:hypothetical protein